MIAVTDLPTVNALLNGISAVLLATGFFLIRRRRIQAHKVCMLSAFTTSGLFLASYVVYHVQAGSVAFAGPAWFRPVYYTILATHVGLAILVVPLALVVLRRALTQRFVKHRALAQKALPLWLYVSITGVVVYLMLYRLFPAS